MTATILDQWERLVPFKDGIQEALRHGGDTHTFEHIVDAVEAGKMQAWCGKDSVVITEIVENPTGRMDLHFFLAAGNEAELKALQPVILEWGKFRGCETATITGRLGWVRSWLTRDCGWKPWLVSLKKDL